jgi:hypothetical protein
MTDTRSVHDDLNVIPPARRRRMALVLAPVGLVLLLAGILTVSLDGVGWKLAGLLVATLAVLLLGVAWGLRRSAALAEATAAEQRLDEVLVAATRSSGTACGGAGAQDSPQAGKSEGSTCGSAGLVCGSADAPGGCGASCLARTR